MTASVRRRDRADTHTGARFTELASVFLIVTIECVLTIIYI